MGIFIIFNVFDIYLITLTSFYIQIFLYSKFMNKKVDVEYVVDIFSYRPRK